MIPVSVNALKYHASLSHWESSKYAGSDKTDTDALPFINWLILLGWQPSDCQSNSYPHIVVPAQK